MTRKTPPSGPIQKPAVIEQLDYEAELVIVMGGGGRIAWWAVADDASAPSALRSRRAAPGTPWAPGSFAGRLEHRRRKRA